MQIRNFTSISTILFLFCVSLFKHLSCLAHKKLTNIPFIDRMLHLNAAPMLHLKLPCRTVN